MSAPHLPSNVYFTESKGPQIIAAVTVLWIGALTTVALRFCARRKSNMGPGWDDWLVLLALIPFSATCIANYVSVHYGAGRHVLALIEQDPGYVQHYLKYVYGVQILYPFIIGPVKCSICCLYIRIFGVNKPFRAVCLGLIIIAILWAISLLLGSIFQCTPIHDAWNPTGNRANCINIQTFLIGTNVPNIVIDFMILIAPVIPIWQLHLPTKKKILVIIILMLGASEVAFSSVRLAKCVRLDPADATWSYFDPLVWSTVEQCMGIVCVCLPVMGPLLPHRAGNWIGGSADSNTKPHSRHLDKSHSTRNMKRKTLSEIDVESVAEHGKRTSTICQITEVHVDYLDITRSSDLNQDHRVGLAM